MLRRGFAALVLGATAALLLALSTASLAADVPSRVSGAITSMGLTLSGLVGLAAGGAFLLVSSGRRRSGLALFGVASLASFAFVVWVSARIPAHAPLVLAASDRLSLREFHEEADVASPRGIEHETLGFRLPHPTLPLLPATEIEEEMRAAAAPGWTDLHEVWAFETAAHDVSVMIDLSRAEAADRASLDVLTTAVVGPLEAAQHVVHRLEVTGQEGCLRAPFDARLASGGRVDAVLFALRSGTRAFHLVVTVVSDGEGDWARWIEGVTLSCERAAASRGEARPSDSR